MSHPERCEFVLLMPDASRRGRGHRVAFENLPSLRTLPRLILRPKGGGSQAMAEAALLRRSPGALVALSSVVDDCVMRLSEYNMAVAMRRKFYASLMLRIRRLSSFSLQRLPASSLGSLRMTDFDLH